MGESIVRVEPINDYLPSIFIVEPNQLDPPKNPFMVSPPDNGNKSRAYTLLEDVNKIKSFYIQQRMGAIYNRMASTSSRAGYERYLQFPNRDIRSLSQSIVESTDSSDLKAYKMLMWVQENIEYVSDTETYGAPEYWALPTLTVNKGRGDCEDGAFLIHSLMLSAGIPYDRIRTYAGAVFAGPGASAGGHAWTAYRREVDDEWVALDWCYYPNDAVVSERMPLRENQRYFDDWFYVDALETVDARYTNTLRGGFVNALA